MRRHARTVVGAVAAAAGTSAGTSAHDKKNVRVKNVHAKTAKRLAQGALSATMGAKGATMSAKETTMTANDATMDGKDATKDGTAFRGLVGLLSFGDRKGERDDPTAIGIALLVTCVSVLGCYLCKCCCFAKKGPPA